MYKIIEESFMNVLEMGRRARMKGVDPETEPEVIVVHSRAELMQELMPELKDFGVRADVLISSLGPEVAGFKAAEETMLGKFGSFPEDRSILLAIRAGLVTINQGYDDGGIYSISDAKVVSQPQKSLLLNYNSAVFKTKSSNLAFSVMIADYVRRSAHLNKYKFSIEEFNSFYNESENSRDSFHVIREIMSHLQIGVSSDEGFGVVSRVLLSIAMHKNRLVRLSKMLNLEGWNWLENLSFKRPFHYIKMPLSQHGKGGFKIRYGRAYNTGFGAVGIHPATMFLLNGLIRTGSVLKLDTAPWYAIAIPVDTIDGPIVELKDGSIVRIENFEDALKIGGKVSKILHLGDILISYNDLARFNVKLKKAGFCNEWWQLLFLRKIREKTNLNLIEKDMNLDDKSIKDIVEGRILPSDSQAINFSKKLGLPLHPKYTFNWDALSVNDYLQLRKILQASHFTLQDNKLLVRYTPEIKRLFKKLLVPHIISNSFLDVNEGRALLSCLGFDTNITYEAIKWMDVNDIIFFVSGITIIPKYVNNVNVSLIIKKQKKNKNAHTIIPFNVDDLAIINEKSVNASLPIRICKNCNDITYKYQCPTCRSRTIKGYYCPRCGMFTDSTICPNCNLKTNPHNIFSISIEEYRNAIKEIGFGSPSTLRPVKDSKGYEIIEKGILRSLNNVSVSNDGIVKIKITNAPLTHFRPKDIGISIHKLKSLGYNYDINGNELIDENQVVKLFPYDVILPMHVGELLLNVTKFVDSELQRVYKLPLFYYILDLYGLIGHLIVGFAPNSRIGVIGRIIGFSESDVLYAHPSWHMSKGRLCNGQEDYIALALDLILNYSSKYLGYDHYPFIVNMHINEINLTDEPITVYDTSWIGEKASSVNISEEANYNNLMFHPGFLINPIQQHSQSILSNLELYLNVMLKLDYVDVEKISTIISAQLIPVFKRKLLKYLTSGFICTKCGAIYKRPPLNGLCIKCDSPLRTVKDLKSLAKYIIIFDKISTITRKRPSIVQNIANTIRDIIKEIEVEEKLDRFL
ncbi:MAG: hypothetical protein ACP5GU_03990 [Thermoprotei archaeon]